MSGDRSPQWRMRRPGWRLWPLLAAATFGCSDGSDASTPETPLACIVVKSDKKTNRGKPLHMLVRSVDDKTYREESYATVADKVTSPDESVLGRAVVFAGIERSVAIHWPDKQPVAVYFMFTEPGGDWRKLVSEPAGSVQLELGEDRINKIASSASESQCAAKPAATSQ